MHFEPRLKVWSVAENILQLFINYLNTRSWEITTLFCSTLRVTIDVLKTSFVKVKILGNKNQGMTKKRTRVA